ncbi:MAG: fasciclin domain-containing protein [Aggregatilineales bacterium]
MDDERLIEGLAFGDYSAVAVSLAPHDILVTFSDDPNRILFRNDGETPPANDLLLLTAMVGDYPDNIAVTGAVSRLPQRTILDFLRSYEDEQGNTFNLLLAAIELANLQEAFTQQDAITLLAPTDAAFMALDASELTGLFTNPEDLQVLLLTHIIDDVFAIRQLNDPLTFETRAGSSVIFSYDNGELRINLIL